MDFYIREDVIMATKNDNLIMQLKEKIELKRKELSSFSTPAYKTRLVIDMDGQKTNINVLDENGLKLLLVKLNMYRLSMKDLGIAIEISGYNVTDWIDDIKAKLDTFTYKKRKKELEETEKQLDLLLSEEKKTELEIERLAKILE